MRHQHITLRSKDGTAAPGVLVRGTCDAETLSVHKSLPWLAADATSFLVLYKMRVGRCGPRDPWAPSRKK